MTKIARMIFVLIFAGITGAFIFLATWDIPAPSSTVEKVLPDDSFPN
ncbi:MAG: hypothetical protein HOO00_01160 [Rhodospirillaceae bacterium]|jgi:hypothetical protein|nr:hypothetical protein [Rhodospirillaceae bacterium]MBT5373407.1 hypothetical protein [Rhodospirillaceae bacterium]MBT5659138.1 hypothetical protein [Rhodospirillaceae bacterium]MBT5751118.1 hypothetical protein [Rhodospirillaceae bacterium]